jgi:hypothetical protein
MFVVWKLIPNNKQNHPVSSEILIFLNINGKPLSVVEMVNINP